MDEWILKEWSHLAPACLAISFFPVFPHNGLLSRHINHQILTGALISPSCRMQQFLPRTPRCHLGYLLLVSLVRSRFGFNTTPSPRLSQCTHRALSLLSPCMYVCETRLAFACCCVRTLLGGGVTGLRVYSCVADSPARDGSPRTPWNKFTD